MGRKRQRSSLLGVVSVRSLETTTSSAKKDIASSPPNPTGKRRRHAANARPVLFRSCQTTRLVNCVPKDFSNRSVRAIGAKRVREECIKTRKVKNSANRATTDRKYRRTTRPH